MAAVGGGFLAGLDKQVADAVLREAKKLAQPYTLPAPALVKTGTEPEPVRMPVAAPEWSGVLDIINGARMHAEAQRDQLVEQARAFDQTIQEMRKDAASVWQQVRVLEAQVQEAKAELARKVREARAQAEERVQGSQAKADAQIALARSITRSAEERAARAEGWLQRIEEASKTLSPRRETIPTRRAA